MKKIYPITLCILLAFSFFIGSINKNYAFAEEKVDFDAKYLYLMDYNSGTEIFAKNENERLPIASMTKIMLLLLINENIDNNKLDINEEITISENASKMGGSQVFLENGGKYKVSDLIKSITVASANDASVAMAERLYGTEQECVKAMNKKVSDLKLNNTLFCNCTGLPKPMQYSSAKDIAIIFSNLIKHTRYFDYSKIWMDKIEHSKNATEISNTNKLIRYYEGCDGGKTGFTNEAGFCLTATAKRGNMRLIGSVINAENSKSRFKAVSDMFNYGFNSFCNKVVIDKNIPLENTINIKNGKCKELTLAHEKDFYVFSKRNNEDDIEIESNIIDNIKAPIKKGDILGESVIYLNKVEIGRVNIISTQNIDNKTYLDYVKEIASNW